jgi:hypothetical protein
MTGIFQSRCGWLARLWISLSSPRRSGILFVFRRQSNDGDAPALFRREAKNIPILRIPMFNNVRRERFLKILADTGSVTAAVALYEPREGGSAWIRNLVGSRDDTAALHCGDRGKPWITV